MLWWTLQQLKSKDEKTRLQAVGKLADQEGGNIIDALVAALTDTNKEVRRTAAKLLGKFKDQKAVRPLISALSDRDTEVRENVAEALKELGNSSAVPALLRFLKDSEPGVRWHAASALENLGWKPNGDAELALLQVAQGKADRCVAYGEAAIDALGLMLRGGQFFKRQQAVEALSRIGGSKVVKPLVDALRDEDAIVRNAAVEALTKVGDARAIDPLLRGLRDKDNRVRATIVDALSKFGDARAIDPLGKLLKDECWDVRMAAIEAMGKFKEPRAIDPLVVCLKDKDRDARQAAVMSLGRIGDLRAVESLVVTLTDENDGVRAAAAAALRRLDKDWEHSDGARRAVPALQQLAKSTDYWIRQTAADTLEKIGEIKQAAPQELATFADPVMLRKQAASEALMSALADSDRDLRQAAAESLGRMGDPHATTALIIALGDYDEWVRRSAAKSLETLNWHPPDSAQKAKLMVNLQKWEESVRLGPAAVEPLVTALRAKTSSVREEAAKALGKIGDTRAITPLVSCVKDNFNFPGVRTAAAVSLVALKWQPDTPEMIALHALETADWEKVSALGNTVLAMLLEYLRDSRVDDERYEGALGALSRINDPHAAGMLALHAEDAELARPILTALEQILAFKAGDISEDDLRQIVNIRNPTTTTYHVDPTTGEYTPEHNETVDFGLPRQLAEQELNVRVIR